MNMLADSVDAVVGGDTHRDTHALEMTNQLGVPIATLQINNDESGFARALRWIVEHAPGPRVVVALEGTRSYGIGLARFLTAAGLTVIEVERPRRGVRRHGKSDPIDAHLAALAALRTPANQLPAPRVDGDREALRILLTARTDLTDTKTAQTNRLRALLLTGTDHDRTIARGRLSQVVLTALARRLPDGRGDDREHIVRQAEIRRLALAIHEANNALANNHKLLAEVVNEVAPTLLTKRGVGPVSAAQAIVSWSHPGRCRNDAAYASLAGVAPLPASSGRTVRHRLNRGGDRALNRALHTIAITRWRCCPTTRDYINRRRAQGKSDPEIRRCLKRYIARELYRALNTTIAT